MNSSVVPPPPPMAWSWFAPPWTCGGVGVDGCECWLMQSYSFQVVLNCMVFAGNLTKCGNKGKYGRQVPLHSLLVGRCAGAQGLGGRLTLNTRVDSIEFAYYLKTSPNSLVTTFGLIQTQLSTAVQLELPPTRKRFLRSRSVWSAKSWQQQHVKTSCLLSEARCLAGCTRSFGASKGCIKNITVSQKRF